MIRGALKPHPKKPIKSTRGISWGPLLTPGPRAVPEFPNGQSAPGNDTCMVIPSNGTIAYTRQQTTYWTKNVLHLL
ncbi:unnamed protein product [Staurois parvus]|uniref:Uncharacterized protein n=1 Tax=Staurois parvus TaxID=386267 RepID=A0ABN9HKK0_9NEOB|nr:unnamed protein product [Staurois parvus]